MQSYILAIGIFILTTMGNYTIGQLARKLSRDFRKNPAQAEIKLWKTLKNRQILNLKFLRQHPIFYQYNNKKNFFIADFYCHEIRTVIELDGHIHIKRKGYDQIRTEMLEFKNIIVIRFKNEEITNDLDTVQKKIRAVILKRKKDLHKY
jgi:very-short-patch-repair endonuclease